MLTIHRAQMDVFRTFMRQRFLERLLRHVRHEMPGTTSAMSDSTLRAIIGEAVIRADGYGVLTEWDLCRFAMYDVRLGARFETSPDHAWAREVLERDGLDGVSRMDLLDQGYFASRVPQG